MLDLKFLRSNPDLVRQALANRHSAVNFDEFASLDETRRALVAETERLKSERNQASAEVARLKRAGQDASAVLAGVAGHGERIKALDEELRGVDEKVQAFLLAMPNVPHSTVPVGAGEADNPVVRVVGDQQPERCI